MSGLRFKLTTLSKWSIGLSALTFFSYLLNIGHSFWLWSYIQRTLAGNSVTGVEAERIDNVGQMLGYGMIGVMVITLIVNGVWIYRASWNAKQIQPTEGRITPGWAVGFYFVPILNLFKPFSAMTQIWNSSHEPLGNIDRNAPAFMSVWWISWVVGPIAGRVSGRMFERADTAEDLGRAAIFDIFASGIFLLTIILFIKIIRAVTTAQQGRVPAELGINPKEGVSS